jgi:hypothetical protein
MLGVMTVFATTKKHEAESIIVRADLECKQGRRAGMLQLDALVGGKG